MPLRQTFALARGPAAGLAAVGVFWGAFVAWMPDIKGRAGVSDGTMGLVLLGTACGSMVAMYLYPRLARRFGARLLPAAAVAMAGAAFLPLAAGGGPAVLFVSLLCMGIAMSCVDIGANVRLSVIETRARVPLMNFAHGVYSASFALAALGSGLVRGAGGPQLLVAGVTAALLLGIARLLVGPAETGEAGPRGAATPWAAVLPAALILFGSFIAENATETWSALHIERTLGAPRGEGAFGPATMGLTMAVGRFGGQALARRLGEARLVGLSTGIGILGALMLAFAPGRGIAVAGVALIGIGVAVIVPSANSLLARRVAVAELPLAISRAWMVGFTGFFLGPVVMGWVAEGAGLRAGFVAVAGMMGLVLVGLAGLTRRR